MTYQRNMKFPFALRSPRDGDLRATLQNGFDQGLPKGVQQAEIAAREDDEPEHDGRALSHLPAVRPLHAAQLVDAVPEERDNTSAALARTGGALLGDGGIDLAGKDDVALDLVGRAVLVVGQLLADVGRRGAGL